MNHGGGQGGDDGSGNRPPQDSPFTTQPGLGTVKSPYPNQNQTEPNQVNPVPQPAQPQAPIQPPPHQAPVPRPQQRFQSQPHPGLPHTPAAAFLRMVGRAFTLNMEPAKVLPAESAQLSAAGITHPETQGFLVWRRSILLVVSILLVPFVIVQAVKTFKLVDDNTPGLLTAMLTFHVLLNFAFAGLCLYLLSRWKEWQRQSRLLLIGWLVFFAMPFVIFLLPIRELFTTDDHLREMAKNPHLAGQALEQARQTVGGTIGLLWMLNASMVLAPKAVSLMPGIVRAAIATKVKFPGAASPGWLVALMAPLYALLVYVVLIGPYQLMGSGWILLALVGFAGAPLWLARSGMRVARPLDQPDADMLMKRARIGYLIFVGGGVLFLFIGFLEIEAFRSGWWIARMLLSLGTNVLLLTIVATDLMFVALDRARTRAAEAGAAELHADYERRLSGLLDGTNPGTPIQPPPPRAPSYHDGPMAGNLQTIPKPGDDQSW